MVCDYIDCKRENYHKIVSLSPYRDKAIDSRLRLWQGSVTIKTGEGTGP